MSLFENFEFPKKTRPIDRESLLIRPAHPDDLTAMGLIYAQRHHISTKQAIQNLEKSFDAQHMQHFSAFYQDHLVAYGSLHQFCCPEQAPDNAVPSGWYLMGIIVQPKWRRRGIGIYLTQFRLEALKSRTTKVFYFANSTNRVSIRLHAKLGFQERRRDIWYPGVKFSGGGVGVLFEKDLSVVPIPAPLQTNWSDPP